MAGLLSNKGKRDDISVKLIFQIDGSRWVASKKITSPNFAASSTVGCFTDLYYSRGQCCRKAQLLGTSLAAFVFVLLRGGGIKVAVFCYYSCHIARGGIQVPELGEKEPRTYYILLLSS